MKSLEKLTGHFITSPFINERFQIPIEPSDYEAAIRSIRFLEEYLRIEESTLQILYSLQEFEKFVLDSSLENYLFPLSDYDYHQDSRIKANIRTLSYLNSVRSFRDQFPKFNQHTKTLGTREIFRNLWAGQKECSVSFRFFDHLRNYAQHQTQPVTHITYGGKWNDDRTLLEKHTSIYVNVDDVTNNRDIDENERNMYRDELGTYADISLVFRESNGCIGKIVKNIRIHLSEEINSSIAIYDSILNIPKLENIYTDHIDISKIKNGLVVNNTGMFFDFINRVKRIKKTYLMENNHEHFISNKSFGHK